MHQRSYRSGTYHDRHLIQHLAGLIGFGGFMLLWHLGALHYNSVILPSPYETAVAVAHLVRDGHVGMAALITCWHTLVGFSIAVLLGSVLGTIAGMYPPIRYAVWPVITILQGIPPIAWIVLAMLWFGMDGGTPIFTVIAATLPIVFVGAVEGTRTVDRTLLEMAQVFRASRRTLVGDIYFPHMLSYLFPVLVAGLGIAWKVALMSELLASTQGIGAALGIARINLDTATALAWIAVAVTMLFMFEYLVLHPLKHHLEPWRQSQPTRHRFAQRMKSVGRAELIR